MKIDMVALLAYLSIFAVVFFLSLYNYSHSISTVQIGLSTSTTNLLIILFSFASIVKTLWHIISF